MTGKEYIDRILDIGYTVHFNEGVWWRKRAPFFYEPAIPLQVIDRGSSKPKMFKALLGYSHLVSNVEQANKYHAILLMNEERLSEFEIKSLSSSKRAQVRKGLRLTEIRKIETIKNVLDDIKEISISKFIRTGYGKPPEYYIKHGTEWKNSMLKQFNADKGKKEYWGSFSNDSLIAFMSIYQIDDTMIISNVSSHNNYLDKCPNDALLFSVLDYCRKLQDCKKVYFGDWINDRPSLNAFKEKYGFKRVDLPVYAKYNFLVALLKKIKQLRQNGNNKD